MPNGDPRDGFFYPTLTLMIDSHNISKGPELKYEKYISTRLHVVAFFPVTFIHLVQYRGINQEQDFLAVRVEPQREIATRSVVTVDID